MAATAFDPGVALGPRLRQVREERGLSLRELARRIACSPSLISQIERGLAAPSVGILYALATELRVSTDYLFGVGPTTAHRDATAPAQRESWPKDPAARRGQGDARSARISAEGAARDGAGAATPPGPALPSGHGVVQRVSTRRTIDLASGVRWERLTPGPDEEVDFLEVVYEPSGHSTDVRRPLRHDGREYGLIVSGVLQATVGFESYELGPGDSIAFGSSVPHEYWNATDQDVRAVWVVVHAPTRRA